MNQPSRTFYNDLHYIWLFWEAGMSPKITFGWRVPDWPEGGANSEQFRQQIFHFTDVLDAGGLDSIWVGDHFFPWADAIDQRLDTIEAWTTLTYLLAQHPKMRGGT